MYMPGAKRWCDEVRTRALAAGLQEMERRKGQDEFSRPKRMDQLPPPHPRLTMANAPPEVLGVENAGKGWMPSKMPRRRV